MSTCVVTVTAVCCLLTTACSSPFAVMANYYDARDPCQSQQISAFNGARLKPEGYSSKDWPVWCGAAGDRGRAVTDTQGRTLGYIR